MLNGIFISVEGWVQFIGQSFSSKDLQSLHETLSATVKIVETDIEKRRNQDISEILSTLTDEDLEKYIALRASRNSG